MTENMQRILLTSLTIIALGGGCILVLFILRRWLSIKIVRQHMLRLSNLGNVPSVYKLHVVAAQPDLQFRLFLGSRPLEEIPLPVQAPPQPLPLAEKILPLQPAQPAHSTSAQPAPIASKTSGNGKKAIYQGRTLASGLERLGNLIPGEAGQWLRQQGQILGKMQRGVSQAVQMQEHVQRKTSRLPKITLRRQANQIEPQSEVTTPPAIPALVSAFPSSYAAQTLPVQPGASVELTLRIRSMSRGYLQGQYPYQITSQQQPLTKISGISGSMAKSAIIEFPPIPRWRIWLPDILSGLVILCALLGLAYSVRFIWL